MANYVIGVDFGTLSGRAVLVDAQSGQIAAESVLEYSHGVTTDQGPAWALQDPIDYLAVLEHTVPSVLREGGVCPEEVKAIGWDVTSCTMLPALSDGTPLSETAVFRNHAHAYVKLWKHLAAAPQAKRIEELAKAECPELLSDYGGKVSSQWMLPKVLQIAEEAPEVYGAAELFLEVIDWLTLVLTGTLVRSSCGAGFKSFWSQERGYPDPAFLKKLHPMMETLCEKQLRGPIVYPWEAAGGLTKEWAGRLGLSPGTIVAGSIIDAHAGLPGSGVAEAGTVLISVGTSTCHMIFSKENHSVPGICGVAKDSVLPDLYAYEAGQACVGDLLDWFVRNSVPAREFEAAKAQGLSIHGHLCAQAELLPPGANGLLALDWWNGQRSPYVDDRLSGLMLGMTIRTTPAQQYRALMESTAYGARLILETFEQGGVPVEKVVACGGISRKNPLMMQIYADVLNRPVRVTAQLQTAALGAAILAASAAKIYETPEQAARAMTKPAENVYFPDAERAARYEELYRQYRVLAEHFAEENPVMHHLSSLWR